MIGDQSTMIGARYRTDVSICTPSTLTPETTCGAGAAPVAIAGWIGHGRIGGHALAS